jgi:ubiquinone/menaquinone biosynthesis C-methylase UbiE
MAAGTGEPSIPAARRVGPEGRVVATDLVEEMIDFAKAKAAKQGIANLELRVANAETLDVGGERFDAVSMRAGIMFMLDPDAAMRNAHAALKPGGRVAISAWAAPDKNLWISSPIGVLKQHVPMPPQQPGAPGPFAFANPERLRSVLADAGFTNVEVEAVELSMAKFPSGSAYVDFLKEMPGPIAMLLGKLPPEKRAQVEAEIATKAQSASGEVDLEGVHWVASAQKAA